MKIPALAALAAALSFSCSPADVAGTSGTSGTSGTGGSGGSSAVAAACAANAYAYCSHLEVCSSPILQQRYGTTMRCESAQTTNCVNVLVAPQTGSTVKGRQACTAATPDWPCADFLQGVNPPPACVSATGPRANGATCAVAPQCQSGYCGLPSGSACGACAPVPQVGASCAVDECPTGMSCLGTPPTCVAHVGMGESCLGGSYCAEGLACVGASSSAPGSCQPSVDVPDAGCSLAGAGCDPVIGLACNGVSNTCVTMKLYGPGQACGVVLNQPSSCVWGICSRGTCVGDVPPGGVCELGGAPCTPSTFCTVSVDGGTTGTCEARGSSPCP